jgi:5-hydroxyisourate hydrolase-like protein (transthyretin family)
MIFTPEQLRAIDHSFNTTLLKIGKGDHPILKALQEYTDDEQVYLKYVYSCLPISDWFNVDAKILISYVRHGIFLYENFNWCQQIPVDIFLDYVVFPRINNEKIEVCRPIFHEQLVGRIQDKSMEEAVIAVNYWCLEKVTYKTTDERTSSPLTLLKTASGRCGEESTFTVTALRSVGIPARQVYVPRWSHCDDNHAWVEAWIDGAWHYLGASEPEEDLDLGWFNAASSRAMMVHSRLFMMNNQVEVMNHLHRYAKTKELSITVVDEYGQPIHDVTVDVEVLNYSEYFPIATLKTNHLGRVKLMTGLGEVHLIAYKDNVYIGEVLGGMHEENVTLIKNNRKNYNDNSLTRHFHPPVDAPQVYRSLSQEEKHIRRKRFDQSDAQRKQQEQQWHKAAMQFIEKEGIEDSHSVEGLIESGENLIEIQSFFEDQAYELEDKKTLLKALCRKDYKDITATMLKHHLNHAMCYKDKVETKVYGPYLLNPRVYYEELTAYREFIRDYFSDEQKVRFIEQPTRVYEYIRSYVESLDEKAYDALYTNPSDLLTYGVGSHMSQKIACVCIYRSLGIPAKLDPITQEVHYWSGSEFVSVHEDKTVGELTLVNKKNYQWEYFQNYTIARQEQGRYVTLNYEALVWEADSYTHKLKPCKYKVITSNRMPNGSLWLTEHYLEIKAQEGKRLEIDLESGNIQDMLKNIMIPNFYVSDGAKTYEVSDILKDKKAVIIWLEEGREPTEHILNELQAKEKEYRESEVSIFFILKNQHALENKTLAKTLERLPDIKVYYLYEESDVEDIARRIFVEPNKYPLTIVTENGLNVVYGFSGYNVGLSSLIMKIFNR